MAVGLPPGDLDVVEVRRDPDVQEWHTARLEDVTANGISCRFQDVSLSDGVFHREDVRFLSLPGSGREPEVGEAVEYRATATGPWRQAVVRRRRGAAFLVDDASVVIVVRASRLQLVPRAASVGDALVREEAPADERLADWLASSDASASLARVEAMALGAMAEPGAAPTLLRLLPASSEAAVVLLGTESAVRRARVLLPAIIQHQLQVLTFEDAVAARARALEERDRRVKGNGPADPAGEPRGRQPSGAKFVRELEADPALLGRFIGRGGANIQALQATHGVRVTVEDGARSERKVVRISGSDAASVAAAAEEAAVVEEALPVPKEMRSWVAGRSFETLNALREAASLLDCRLDRDDEALVFTGSETACLHARELFGAHMMYFDAFQALDGQIAELAEALREHGDDREATTLDGLGQGGRGGKGRGKGKGRGRPRGGAPPPPPRVPTPSG